MAYGALIICATPRSGSTLLCDLLAGTGVAGRPDSFYRRQSIPDFARRFGVADTDPDAGPDFDRAYLAAALHEGTAGDLFGLRLMWPSVPELSATLDGLFPGLAGDAARFAKAFGRPLYLHLSRRDRIAQAVSRLKAEQTGLWHVAADGTERERTAPPHPPVYSADGIAGFIAEAEAHEAAWAHWFASNDIAPLRLTCEALVADTKSELAGVLGALGRAPSAAETSEVQTMQLSNDESREWARRYRSR